MVERQRIEKSDQYSVISDQYLYPEDRSCLPEVTNVSKEPWIVVRTKTKCEKFIRDRLQLMGMEAFVPLRKRTAKYNRKVKVYELPLITCYTFVRLDKTRRNEVLALPYVQGMLRIAGHDCLVSDREIQWLQKISGTDIDVRTEPLSMRQGDRVVLASGQLAGMEGVIMSQRSKHEMIVALESIGMQMVIQVDTSVLELAW
ncbi:MAG TPA: UpxY family transcription antiterminator [Saprospiraceae bacterium]|nr:UpxY family transcription antiterminator [Saprospiraceae bacterium]